MDRLGERLSSLMPLKMQSKLNAICVIRIFAHFRIANAETQYADPETPSLL